LKPVLKTQQKAQCNAPFVFMRLLFLCAFCFYVASWLWQFLSCRLDVWNKKKPAKSGRMQQVEVVFKIQGTFETATRQSVLRQVMSLSIHHYIYSAEQMLR